MVENFEFVVLTIAALLTAILSGTIGMGGGIILLTVMAQVLPLPVLVPTHGLVQLSSNSSRALLHFRDINFKIAGQYAIGALTGASIGYFCVIDLPEGPYKIGLGLFILFLTFGPRPQSIRLPFKWPLVGSFATFISLFVGATGPLIAPFYLNEGIVKEKLVATKAACQIFTHIFKIGAFFALGFGFAKYAPLIISMALATVLGNYIGKLILNKISPEFFVKIFKVIIALLSIRLIIKGALVLAAGETS